MMENLPERKQDKVPKPQFILTGFTQTAGKRMYAFETRVEGRRIANTVEVDLALIPGYGIRIQDLPLLCRELLEQRTEPDEISAFVFTELQMRSHAEKLASAREAAEQRRKQPRHLVTPNNGSAWRNGFR
jgi:hypothetical protein